MTFSSAKLKSLPELYVESEKQQPSLKLVHIGPMIERGHNGKNPWKLNSSQTTLTYHSLYFSFGHTEKRNFILTSFQECNEKTKKGNKILLENSF